MIPLPSGIENIWMRIFTHVYKRCAVISQNEIKRTFGQAWRGGRFQWPFQLPGHGFELQQTGTRTFTPSELTITTDLFTIPTPITYPIAYDVLADDPRVFAQSYDTDWVATAYPTPGSEHTEITLALKRADSRTQIEFGFVFANTVPNHAIPAGLPYSDVPVTFPTAFATGSTPIVVGESNNPNTRVTTLAGSVTTTGAIFRVLYVPSTASGEIGYSVTGIMPSAGVERTNMGGAETLSTGHPGGGNSPFTDDPWTGTDGSFGGESPTTGTSVPSTHSHTITSPGTSTTTTSDGAHDHVHHHKHDLDHTHGLDTTDHDHGLTEPGSGPTLGHTHTFTGDAENAPSDTFFTLHWTALGGKVVTAATVIVAWQAIGTQAS